MAQNNMGSPFAGTLDENDAGSGATNIDPDVYSSIMDVDSARTALKSLDVSYTDEKLDNMTKNDMVYALRVLLQPDSFIQPALTDKENLPVDDGAGGEAGK